MSKKSSQGKVVPFPREQSVDEANIDKQPVDFSKFPKVHNREETRALEKVLRQSGKTKNEIAGIIELSKMITKAYDSESDTRYKQHLNEDEMVKLNIDKMWSYPDWDNRQESYKEYVRANIDTIFTVNLIDGYEDRAAIVNLADDTDVLSPWSFCEKDLLVYDASDRTFKEMWLIEEAISE